LNRVKVVASQGDANLFGKSIKVAKVV